MSDALEPTPALATSPEDGTARVERRLSPSDYWCIDAEYYWREEPVSMEEYLAESGDSQGCA